MTQIKPKTKVIFTHKPEKQKSMKDMYESND